MLFHIIWGCGSRLTFSLPDAILGKDASIIELSKMRASAMGNISNSLFFKAESVFTRRLDIAGVASSILATPTMIRPWKSLGF